MFIPHLKTNKKKKTICNVVSFPWPIFDAEWNWKILWKNCTQFIIFSLVKVRFLWILLWPAFKKTFSIKLLGFGKLKDMLLILSLISLSKNPLNHLKSVDLFPLPVIISNKKMSFSTKKYRRHKIIYLFNVCKERSHFPLIYKEIYNHFGVVIQKFKFHSDATVRSSPLSEICIN